jgi:hypothetical protein
MGIKLEAFLKAIDEEYRKAEKIYKEARKSAQEVAAAASASPSQSGDRFHSQGTADLAKLKFDSISRLKVEVGEKGEKICTEYKGETVFLVDNPILISGFKIVSTKSPLGQIILGSK